MAITNSCAAGREMPRTSKSINLIYMITRTEISRVYRQTARHSKSRQHNILPIRKCCTSDLVLRYPSQLLGCKQRCRIEPKLYQLEVSSCVVNDASPPWCLKNRNKKRIDTRIQHIVHIIARAIKPNRMPEPVFQKEEKIGPFSIRPQTGSFRARI